MFAKIMFSDSNYVTWRFSVIGLEWYWISSETETLVTRKYIKMTTDILWVPTTCAGWSWKNPILWMVKHLLSRWIFRADFKRCEHPTSDGSRARWRDSLRKLTTRNRFIDPKVKIFMIRFFVRPISPRFLARFSSTVELSSNSCGRRVRAAENMPQRRTEPSTAFGSPWTGPQIQCSDFWFRYSFWK